MTADSTATVSDLRALLERQKQALSEAGRPDLADNAKIIVTEHSVHLNCAESPTSTTADPMLLKAMSLDPEWEALNADAGNHV